MIPATPTAEIQARDIPSTAILALSFAAFCSGMSMRIADSMLVRLAHDFSITLGTASIVITVFSIAYGLSQLLFGPLGDRYGKYLVISWGCVICSVTTLFCGLAPDFSTLVVFRFLAGASCASLIPLSMAWIGDVIAYENRQSVLARFMIGLIFGMSSGVMLGGISADYLNWRFPFFVIAASFLAISFYLVKVNRRLPSHAKVLHKVDGHAFARMVSEFRQVLSVSWARIVLSTVTIEGGLVYGTLAFIPTHLHAVHGLPLSAAGALVMLFGLGGFVFAMHSRDWVSRLGEVGLVRRGSLMMALSILVIAFSPAWWAAMPGCALFGLGFYMMHNTLQINATQMAPERRGAAVAAFASCFFLGQSVGVGITGVLVERLGSAPLMGIASLGVLLVGLRFARLMIVRAP